MTEPLPPATAQLWNRLKDAQQLAGFYLIGGSALALLIGHRQSEDLDLAWSGDRLPRGTLSALVKSLEGHGWSLERDDSPAAYEEFQIAGMDLHDYQQDFIATAPAAGAVKLSFFVPPAPLAKLLPPTGQPSATIPTLTTLFKSKALATASRSASRDWLDLYLLMTEHAFTIEDYAATFAEVGARLSLDVGMQRLISGRLPLDDPGFASLLSAAPSVADMTQFFRSEITRWRQQLAEDRLGRQGD